jgi:predicted Zn-dependent protease
VRVSHPPDPISPPNVSRRERRTDPTTLMALALVLGGALFLLRGRSGSPAPPCDPDGDAGCAVDARPAGMVAPAPRGAPHPVAAGALELSESAACRNVSYLCSDLEPSGQMRIQRWRDFEGTMVVHVPLPDLPDRAQAYALRSAATAGVRLWNGQPFPILVDERGTREAQVEVRWVRSLGGAQIGLARTEWNPRTGLSVHALELVTASPVGAGALDPRDVRLTAAHEMGHALGLPHSDDPRDLMYPANTATSLTARDYRAIEALYDFEDGTVIVR